MGQLLEEYDLAQRQLKQIEHELHLILERIPYAKKLLEIRGVNATSLAGVLGEAGDLSGYAHGNALLRHAGLNLAEASSGKWRGKMVLSKRGRPRLRHFLYLLTMCMVMTNPDVRALHHHNVDGKKIKRMKSIMKLCGKVARLLVGLGAYVLPPLIGGFCSRFPGVQIELNVTPTRRAKERLLNQETDLAFYYAEAAGSPDGPKPVKEEKISQDRIELIFSGTHAFAGLKSVTQQLIAQQFFAQHGEGAFMTDYARAYAAASGIHLWERTAADSPEIVKNMVRSGEFISLFPLSGIREELASGALRSLPLPGRPIQP
ncbi:LysR substrate-binding domain-containing protein [Paenibacillus azoreducens]|uniref:LysR substrate-binding domain-containing protein n=1 Tax=Paenibacillus azoreducens TaxID=116718 RepID=UPI0039F5F98C